MKEQPKAVEKTCRCPVCSADIKQAPFSKSALNPHYRKRHPEYFLWLKRWTRILLHVVTPVILLSTMLVLVAFPHLFLHLVGGLSGIGVVLLLSFYLRVGSFRKAWQVKYERGVPPGSSVKRGPR